MPNMVTEFLFLISRIFKKLQRKGVLKSLSPSYKFNKGKLRHITSYVIFKNEKCYKLCGLFKVRASQYTISFRPFPKTNSK